MIVWRAISLSETDPDHGSDTMRPPADMSERRSQRFSALSASDRLMHTVAPTLLGKLPVGLLIIFTVLAFVMPSPSHAARVALVLGNSSYQHVAELENPLNDAKAVSGALERLGFEVLLGTDLGFLELRRLLRDFGDRVAESGAQTSLFYYAGHGLQVSGRNYIVPTDAKLENERDLESELGYPGYRIIGPVAENRC